MPPPKLAPGHNKAGHRFKETIGRRKNSDNLLLFIPLMPSVQIYYTVRASQKPLGRTQLRGTSGLKGKKGIELTACKPYTCVV